jgi:2-methylcitrate dehydratase
MVRLLHTDASICGVSAIAMRSNAPIVLRHEAMDLYSINPEARKENDLSKVYISRCFGAKVWSYSEKAIMANMSAVREWDANGTVFGYNKIKKCGAGEFGHNDYYPVVIAACHNNPIYNGEDALKGMILLDEIRGRLAEVFSLKSYKIDHVLHGSIASAAVYGAMLDCSAEEIESAIGMLVAHYVPWRAIRAGPQLSDSKGASAGITTEMAIQSIHRAKAGFVGPKDIFTNPDAVFRQSEPQEKN